MQFGFVPSRSDYFFVSANLNELSDTLVVRKLSDGDIVEVLPMELHRADECDVSPTGRVWQSRSPLPIPVGDAVRQGHLHLMPSLPGEKCVGFVTEC